MKRQHGFTLIEVLAVIVILAVIALISTPIVLNVIEKTRKEAYKNSSLNAFKAAELYEAKNDFTSIDKNGINISDLELDNNKFTSGKIVKNDDKKIELVNVTDGIYCSKGTKENLIVVKGSCDLLDETAPTNIKIVTNSVSTNKIVIAVYAEDDESGIKQYHYSLDGIDYKTTKSSSIELTNLESGKNYKVYIKVENNNGLVSEIVEKEITTKNIISPTYSIDKDGWATEKKVTIIYSEKEEGYIYMNIV